MHIARPLLFLMLIVQATMTVLFPGAASAAITEPTWQIDEVLPGGTSSPRPFPVAPTSILPFADGKYAVVAGDPVGFGTAEYNADGSFHHLLLAGGYVGVDGSGGNRGSIEAADGTIWLTEVNTSRVEHRHRDGSLIAVAGTNGSGPGQFNQPSEIDIAPDGTLLIVDSGNDRIQRLSADGTFLASYGSNGAGNGEFDLPFGIAVADDGSFYVSELFNHRVQHFASDGTYIAQWGAFGSTDGQFNEAAGIHIADNGDVIVADSNNHRLQRFTSTGTHITNYGTGVAGSALGQFNTPRGIAGLADGRLAVIDGYNARIVILASDGTPIEARGESAAADNFRTPAFIAAGGSTIIVASLTVIDSIVGTYPYACTITAGCSTGVFGAIGSGVGEHGSVGKPAVDQDGSVWIADSDLNKILHYSADGTYISEFGTPGSGADQLSSPTAIDIASDDTLWVADAANSRLQHFTKAGLHLGQVALPWAGQLYALDILSDGSFLVGNLQASELIRVRSDGTIIWTASQEGYGPIGVLALGDGTALVGGLVGGHKQISLSDGSLVRDISLPNVEFATRLTSFAKLSDGRIVATDPSNSRLVIISLHEPPPLVVAPSTSVPSVVPGNGTISFGGSGGSAAGYTFASTWIGGATRISNEGVLDLSKLAEGRVVLRVVITDSAGRTALWEQTITVDRTAPRFSATNPRFTVRRDVNLSVTDALSTPTATSTLVRVRRLGSNTVRATLRDEVGNSATRTYRIIRRPSLSRGPLNSGVALWRPGSTFIPGSTALNTVFGNGARNAFGSASGNARSPFAPALVREVQFRLKQSGHMTVVTASSGNLNAVTRSSIRRYQRANGLSVTGLPDRKTRTSMDSTLEASAQLRRH